MFFWSFLWEFIVRGSVRTAAAAAAWFLWCALGLFFSARDDVLVRLGLSIGSGCLVVVASSFIVVCAISRCM